MTPDHRDVLLAMAREALGGLVRWLSDDCCDGWSGEGCPHGHEHTEIARRVLALLMPGCDACGGSGERCARGCDDRDASTGGTGYFPPPCDCTDEELRCPDCQPSPVSVREWADKLYFAGFLARDELVGESLPDDEVFTKDIDTALASFPSAPAFDLDEALERASAENDFHAAFDPQTALALIAEVRRLRLLVHRLEGFREGVLEGGTEARLTRDDR